MNKKLETWCYGGKSKAFFIEKSEVIHQYNTVMMDRLLLVMVLVLGYYVAAQAWKDPFTEYFVAYASCFATLLVMRCSFRLKVDKSIRFTRIYITLFSCVMFTFVCILGTVFEPDSRAIMFIVYLLTLPMLFVSPTHCTYGFLIVVTCIFSIISLRVKDIEYAYMDVAHGITCLVIGIFLSRHILKNQMMLYALNEKLDVRNYQLDKELQEKENLLLQSRISILLSQIQPHFLYNTLTVICGLCDENPKEAKKVTAEFADYLRHNLNTLTQSTPIPFLDELQHTERYLSIEKKRFEEKLSVVYDIETKDFCIPALTVQPLVENAVKHGILKKKKGGTVTIATRNSDNCYEIIITDDGAGFDPSALQLDDKVHIGIENVRNRLLSMCGGTLTVESEVGRGVTAIIKLPKEDIEI